MMNRIGLLVIGLLISLSLIGCNSAEGNVTEVNEVEEQEQMSKEEKEVAEKEAAEKETREKEVAKEKAEKEEEEKATAEAKAKEEAEAEKKAEAEQKEKDEKERKTREAALKQTGKGDTVTKKFLLEEGFLITDSSHSGQRNFIVSLHDGDANRIESIANKIGNYKGKQIFSIDDTGEYQLDVKADGDWAINMSQSIPETIEEDSISGSGDDVRFVQIDKGGKTFHLSHTGSRNFMVRVNDQVSLANEIGPYEGSKLQKVEDDSIYYFNIYADGDWEIEIE